MEQHEIRSCKSRGEPIQWQKEIGQTTIYKTPYRKLKMEQHEIRSCKSRGEPIQWQKEIGQTTIYKTPYRKLKMG
jgi:hypothetical protein